jgi:thiamine transport system permease protein
LRLYEQMGSYRVGDAAVTALVLVGLCLGLFAVIEKVLAGRVLP